MKKNSHILIYLSFIPLFIIYLLGNQLNLNDLASFLSWWDLFTLLLLLFYSLFIHVFLHESGHFLFGRVTGYTLIYFQAGRFRYDANTKKITQQKNKVPGMLGQCLMEPPPKKNYEEKPYVLYLAGGLFINAFTGLLLYAGSFYFTGIVGFYFFVLSVFPVILVFLNLIPQGYTDGKMISEMKKNTLTKKLFFQQLEIASLLEKGYTFLQIPDFYYEEANNEKAKNSLLGEYIQMCDYRRQLEKLDFVSADQRLNDFLAHTDYKKSVYAPMVLCEKLFCDAVFGRKKSARQQITVIHKYPQVGQYYAKSIRIRAAYEFFVETKVEKAQKLLNHIDSNFMKDGVEGDIKTELNVIGWLKTFMVLHK